MSLIDMVSHPVGDVLVVVEVCRVRESTTKDLEQSPSTILDSTCSCCPIGLCMIFIYYFCIWRIEH